MSEWVYITTSIYFQLNQGIRFTSVQMEMSQILGTGYTMVKRGHLNIKVLSDFLKDHALFVQCLCQGMCDNLKNDLIIDYPVFITFIK